MSKTISRLGTYRCRDPAAHPLPTVRTKPSGPSQADGQRRAGRTGYFCLAAAHVTFLVRSTRTSPPSTPEKGRRRSWRCSSHQKRLGSDRTNRGLPTIAHNGKVSYGLRCGRLECVEHRQEVIPRLQIPTRMLDNMRYSQIRVPRIYFGAFKLPKRDARIPCAGRNFDSHPMVSMDRVIYTIRIARDSSYLPRFLRENRVQRTAVRLHDVEADRMALRRIAIQRARFFAASAMSRARKSSHGDSQIYGLSLVIRWPCTPSPAINPCWPKINA